MKDYRPLFTLALLALPLFCQVPQINPGGVVNAASYASPIAPGSIASIFGTNLANAEAGASGNLPLILSGTSVTVAGIPAPLWYVSANQINFQVPQGISPGGPFSPEAALDVVVTTGAGVSAPVQVETANPSAPGTFTLNGSGCGPIAALNVSEGTGALSVNSASNSVSPGDYLAIYGTGFGLPATAIPDGVPAPGAAKMQYPAYTTLGGSALPNFTYNTYFAPVPVPGFASLLDGAPTPLYTGLAPGFAGMDQVNIQVPIGTPEGCAVPVQLAGTYGLTSQITTVSVRTGGGPCVDPPVQSYGQIELTKVVTSGPGAGETDSLTATFPSGPGLQLPVPATTLGTNEFFLNDGVAAIAPPYCAIPGQTDLSTGALTVTPPAGGAAAVPPQPIAGGVTYSAALPAGFVTQGAYALSSPAGNSVGPISATLNVGAPIQVQTPLPPGTVLQNSITGSTFTVTWAGGDANSMVGIWIVSDQGVNNIFSFVYTPATAHSYTFDLSGTGFGTPNSQDAQIVFEVVPNPSAIQTITVPGVTEGVQLLWSYRYVFGGLSIQ